MARSGNIQAAPTAPVNVMLETAGQWPEMPRL